MRGGAGRKKEKGPFPFPDFNPTKPDLSNLPAIATSEAKTVTIFEAWPAKMQALGQPPTGQAAWADVMRALESHVRIIEEQQAAAENSDGQTFTKDYYEGHKAQDQMEKAADAAGIPVCATLQVLREIEKLEPLTGLPRLYERGPDGAAAAGFRFLPDLLGVVLSPPVNTSGIPALVSIESKS
jgi:hypothetical protein